MARIIKKQKTSPKTSKAKKTSVSPKKVKKPAPKALKKTTPKKPIKKLVLKKTALKKQPLPKVVVKKTVVKISPKKKADIVKPTQPKPQSQSASISKTSLTSDLTVGSVAPSFTMPATLVGTLQSEDLKDKAYVLYFYPKDDTSGCTAEACEFRNTLPHFSQLNLTIIGVSKDNMESHEKFSRKYNLTFPLASDHTTSVCESFGTWVQKSMYGRSYMGIERSTFLIDGQGIIRAIWRKVSVPGHVEEVRKAVENL